MTDYQITTDYQNVLSLCDQLLGINHSELSEAQREAQQERTADLCEKLLDGLKSIGITVQEAAARLGFSDETLYRWKKLGKGPKPVYVRQLRDIVSEKQAANPNKRNNCIRIGVPPFWDAALIRAWETALRSHGMVPKFVSVSHMIHELHDAFRDGDIDVAIHNGFLIHHDQTLEAKYKLGLQIKYPLYKFSGYFMYARRNFVQSVRMKLLAASVDSLEAMQAKDNPVQNSHRELDESDCIQESLRKLSDGDWAKVLPKDKKAALHHLLKGAYLGVERGTGMELACRTAYQNLSLSLDIDAFINLRNDQLQYYCPINDIGKDPNLADTSQAFDAFVDGSVDIFCGGLAHHYYFTQQNEAHSLEQQNGMYATNKVSSMKAVAKNVARRATDGETFVCIFGPADLGVSAINGVVTRQDHHAATAAIIADVWHAGIDQFQNWYAATTGKDEAEKSLAIIQLSAMMRLVEAQTSIGSYTPHGARIAPVDITQTGKWPVWIDKWQADHALAGSQDEQREELTAFARKSIDLFRQDWRVRVWQWAKLIMDHCHFFATQAEGQAVYAAERAFVPQPVALDKKEESGKYKLAPAHFIKGRKSLPPRRTLPTKQKTTSRRTPAFNPKIST